MWPFSGSGRDTRTLPLFPLNTVLFPGGMLPLRIFEQRYIEMARTCLAQDAPFGVCLITQGDEVAVAGAPAAQIATVGTLARITEWDMPQLGILQVSALGETRFQVRSHAPRPNGLVMAEVTPLAPEARTPLAAEYRPLATLLELVASRVGPNNFPVVRDYDDASWVGYRLAEVLPLPLHIKQSMLEINEPGVRLEVLQRFLAQQGLI